MNIQEYNALAQATRNPYRPYTEAECAAIRAMGKGSIAGEWDCASFEKRQEMFPQLNPNKRWFEQKAYEKI